MNGFASGTIGVLAAALFRDWLRRHTSLRNEERGSELMSAATRRRWKVENIEEMRFRQRRREARDGEGGRSLLRVDPDVTFSQNAAE
jgi:hypothetical protein